MKLVPIEPAGAKPAAKSGAAQASGKYLCPMHGKVVTDRPGNCPICGMKLEPVPAALLKGEVKTPSGAAPTYFCPMHPTTVSDRPGACPICQMDLEPIPDSLKTGWAHTAGSGRRILYYRSPMDPAVRSNEPAKDSMGMDFVPVYEDEVRQGTGTVPGRSSVALSSERRALLGVRSEEVREGRIDRFIRTVGRVTADERRLAHVHTKFEGYVERLYVDFTGKFVKKGDPLLALYSPELIATQQEYLLALRAQKQLGSSQIPSVAQGGASLAEAARERLRLWDISEADIAELERTGTVRRAFDLHAEVSGFVTVKNVVQGMRVMPADTIFEIADLSHVWVLADVYESDLRSIRLGMPATLTLSYQAGRAWRGKVSNIAPTLDSATRTVKVRIDVANQGGALKPDMFGDVELRVEEGSGLVVPDSAVIDTGDRRLVFLDRPDGTIEPRAIEVGAKLADGYQVLRGLARGDRVVIAANFLLDSESSLKAALSALTAPAPAPIPEKR
jgi:RND family efflux transporter MFP subunit